MLTCRLASLGILSCFGLLVGLSTLNTSGTIPYSGQSPGANLGANMLPVDTWWSEASFTAFRVPAPGTLALLGLGGLAALRRRR